MSATMEREEKGQCRFTRSAVEIVAQFVTLLMLDRTDHIVKRFGSDLRRRAGSDNAIAAMGVSGGVSGYLQSVLVPEMALALVMEDADCDADEAKRIIEESSDIGEALNEAEEEKVPQSTARLLRDESEENLHEGRHTILLD